MSIQRVTVFILILAVVCAAQDTGEHHATHQNASVRTNATENNPLTRTSITILSPAWQIGNASNQIIARHYCFVNQTSKCAECLCFDAENHLLGIKYIVERSVFEQLPLQERQLWSSHEWEVKNGLVAMPDVEPAVESQALGILANSYSKNIGMVKGMTALEALKEKLSEKNTTDRSVRRPPAGSTSSPSASVQSTRFQALQTKLAAKSNRTAGAGNATSETKEQAPKIDMAEFPFGIPQFFATFTAKGPKLSDSIKQELDRMGKSKIVDRKKQFSNLTTAANKTEGADSWQTGQGIQLDVIQLPLRDGTAEAAHVRNKTASAKPGTRVTGKRRHASHKQEEEESEESKESKEQNKERAAESED